jgi:hypothetical protein
MGNIYKIFIFVFLFFSLASNPLLKSAEAIDAQKLLKQVDDNLWSNTKFISGRLIIDNGRKVRTLTQALKITTLISSGFLLRSFSALIKTAVATTAVPCWSS